MTIASIDIGSNTVLLLIAEVTADFSIIPVYNGHSMPRLGSELKPGKPLTNTAINRLFMVLSEYKTKIEEFDCEKVLVTGTNALRICSNQNEIKELIKHKYGWNLRILSGEEEARLAFISANELCREAHCLVIDIGGGSTELIYGSSEKISFLRSYVAGAVSAREQFFHNDPPTDRQINNLRNELMIIFSDIPDQIKNVKTAVAQAGTPATLAALKLNLKQYRSELIEGTELTIMDMYEITRKLKLLTKEQIFKLFPEIMKGREDIILAGTIILTMLTEIIKPGKMLVSTRGLRYGVVKDYINNLT